jgi:hypothetical protein
MLRTWTLFLHHDHGRLIGVGVGLALGLVVTHLRWRKGEVCDRSAGLGGGGSRPFVAIIGLETQFSSKKLWVEIFFLDENRAAILMDGIRH